MRPWEFMNVLTSVDPSIVAVDDFMPRTMLEDALFDGLGIIMGKSVKVHCYFLKRSRKVFEKRGSIVFFRKAPFSLLDKTSGDVFYLVTEMYVGDTSTRFSKTARVGVIHAEYAVRPHAFKMGFEPYKVYSGDIRYGKRTYSVRWMVWIPTYRARDAMILCHPDDVESLANLFYKYKHMKRGNRIMSVGMFTAAPLFSYRQLLELLSK